MDVDPVFVRLLSSCGAGEARFAAACQDAYNSPTGVIFGVPTPALSRFLKVLKARAAPDTRALVEDAFMKFVSKVRDNEADRGVPA